MRDLHKTLKRFSDESPMDFCEEFDEIKSVLLYCNKHVKPFNKLHFRGGNELFINELTRRLQQVLLEHDLVDADSQAPLPNAHQKLRKILMFLLANTDATYKYNLRSDPHFAHVLEQCPLLPKFLLVTLVWELKLDQYFYEALSFTPCWFAFQYFETAADSMKYIDDPYAVLEKVEQLMRAMCMSIARAEMRRIDNVDKKIIFGKLYDYSMNLLRQFYTPDAEKFKQFKKLEFFKYSGFALKHILQMVLFAFDLYEKPENETPDFDISIYEICQNLCKKVPPQEMKHTKMLKEQLLKIIAALLNSLQYNVMLVKIDVFMYWVEVDLTTSMTLQMAIGEMVYHVAERMQANPQFAHDVEPQLKLLAIRPKTLEETIREATLGDILRSLDEPLDPQVKKAWFDELFNRTLALGNDECVQTIRANIKLMSPENCRPVLDYIKLDLMRVQAEENAQNEAIGDAKCFDIEKMEIDHSDYEQLTKLIVDALPNFKTEDILQLLMYLIRNFGKGTHICCQREDFQHRATEFFNKCTSVFEEHQFLVLCFEAPKDVWAKFFDCACHNSEHVKNFCRTVVHTDVFSTQYVSEMLADAMRDHSKLQQKFFPELLCEIYFTLYYGQHKTEFFKQFINKNVNALLDTQAFGLLLPIVKALNLIATSSESHTRRPLKFGEVTAPVLLMIAQIMDKARWDLISYTDERDELVRECIQFIQYTSKKFLPVATEKDRKWITKVIKDSYKPITQYYFQKFSLTAEQPPVDFDRFLIRLEIEDKSEAEMFLIINYVRCTTKETEWLARSARLLPHISDVMIILGGVVVESDHANAINNYRHCLSNYANIVMKFVLPTIENDTRTVEKLMLKVLKIIASSPQQVYEEIFLTYNWLLLEIMRRCARPVMNSDGIVKAIKKTAGSMKNCQGKEIFLDKFHALVKEFSS